MGPFSWRRYLSRRAEAQDRTFTREEESFHLPQGTLTIQAGGKTLNASPGDFVHLPRGMVHSFQNTGNVDAKFLVVVTPAGLEKFFEEAFYPALDSSSAPPLVTEALL